MTDRFGIEYQPMTQQSAARAAGQAAARHPAGSWVLKAGKALTLRPHDASVLRIAQGRVWATTVGPHPGPGNDRGDIVLEAGQTLTVLPGQSVVMEAWTPGTQALDQAAASFTWDPVAVVADDALRAGSRWQQAVVYPLRDFGIALALAGGALGRLVSGLLGYGEFLVAGRGRVLPCFESNPP